MNPLAFPKLEKYVNDFSGILPPETIERLSATFSEHEKRTTEQVVTVFFPHRQGNELIDIGLNIFNENGIGQKNLNNGLLLIVATEEKKIRIITGKGMEIQYSEMRCRDIIENHLRPLLNEGKYEELIKRFGEIIKKPNKISNFSPDIQKKLMLIPYSLSAILISPYIIISHPELLHSNWLFLLLLGIPFSAFIGFITFSPIDILPMFRSFLQKYFISGIILANSPVFLTFLALIVFPPVCTETRDSVYIKENCVQTIFGYQSTYNNTSYTEEYRASHPKEFSTSDHSSSSSNFGGGGGSSNGGGGGD